LRNIAGSVFSYDSVRVGLPSCIVEAKTIPLDRWLRHLRHNLSIARECEDPEGVHQVRVATRRIETWLLLAGWHVYRDDLRWLRVEASSARDVDVLLLRAGLPKRLKDDLTDHRRTAYGEFLLAAEDPRLQALIVGLGALPPLAPTVASTRMGRLLAKVLERGKQVSEEQGSLESLHGLRRALRRLRYGLELTGGSTASLKRLQDALGHINDLAVAIRCLDDLGRGIAPAGFRATLQSELSAARPVALQLWSNERDRIRLMVAP